MHETSRKSCKFILIGGIGKPFRNVVQIWCVSSLVHHPVHVLVSMRSWHLDNRIWNISHRTASWMRHETTEVGPCLFRSVILLINKNPKIIGQRSRSKIKPAGAARVVLRFPHEIVQCTVLLEPVLTHGAGLKFEQNNHLINLEFAWVSMCYYRLYWSREFDDLLHALQYHFYYCNFRNNVRYSAKSYLLLHKLLLGLIIIGCSLVRAVRSEWPQPVQRNRRGNHTKFH